MAARKNPYKGKSKRGKTKERPTKPAVQQSENYDRVCVKFSFEHVALSGIGGFDNLEGSTKASIVEAMVKRRTQTWNDIKQQSRHKLGIENISKDSIQAPINRMPQHIQRRDVFMAFRYHGKMAMVGFRDKDVFYPIWFDANFHNKSVYGH